MGNKIKKIMETTIKTPNATPELTPQETPQETHLLFHKLWTSCIGTANYNKTAWKDIELQLQDTKNI